MEILIKRVLRNLKIQYFFFWLLPVLLVVGFETDILPTGLYAHDGKMQYILETIGVLLAIACVPIALKLFNLVLKNKIDQLSIPVALSRYSFWSSVRLGLIAFAVLFNIVVYYLTLNNIGGLCALLALTASTFCIPGNKRLHEELKTQPDDNLQEDFQVELEENEVNKNKDEV